MEYLDTPEEHFVGLTDYPFEPHFAQVDPAGLRMHYVDEGPRDGRVVLLLHGEPSWSYLYRFMIPPLVDAGLRVVAPDLIGFGKSSKPTALEDYTYARHVAWTKALLDHLSLRDITLFGQDWGSLVGLRLVGEDEARFAAVMIGNGFLPEAKPPQLRGGGWKVSAAFLTWRTFARYSPWFPISRILDIGSARTLTDEEKRAYDAPFPDARYLAGARAFPRLVPLSPQDPARPAQEAAWRTLEKWHKPFVTAFSKGDPITAGLDRQLRARIPGCSGQDHSRVRGGHFLQEDSGPTLAARLATLALTI